MKPCLCCFNLNLSVPKTLEEFGDCSWCGLVRVTRLVCSLTAHSHHGFLLLSHARKSKHLGHGSLMKLALKIPKFTLKYAMI